MSFFLQIIRRIRLRNAFEKLKLKVTDNQIDMTIDAVQNFAIKHKINYMQTMYIMADSLNNLGKKNG